MERFSQRTRAGDVVFSLYEAFCAAAIGKESPESLQAASPRLFNGRMVLAASTVTFCLHFVLSRLLPSHGSITCLGLGSFYVLAGFAACRAGLMSEGVMRARWLLMALGLGVGFLGFAVTLYRECLLGVSNPRAELQDLLLMLRSLPLLVAICLSRREFGKVFVALDLVQATLMTLLVSFVLLFGAPNYLPVGNHAAISWILGANLMIAVLATVRCFGVLPAEEERFFRLSAVFLWSNVLVLWLVDFYVLWRWRVAPASSWLVLGDLPLFGLIFALCRLTPQTGPKTGPGEHQTSFAETACSFFMPACSLLLAASIVPFHLNLGMAAVAISFVLYGLRSTVELKSSLFAQHELLMVNRSMQDQAFSDSLTGIPNRRRFDLTLEQEWKRAQRSRQPLALLMFDVDRFKELNDVYGHLAGDACLREIAGVLRTGLGREADFVSRYGGEEFAVLLVDTGTEGARIVAEALRRAVELHCCTFADGTRVTFTVSVGVASEIPIQLESSVTLVAAADKALYRAKRDGRNRVEVHAWRTDVFPAVGLAQ